MAEKIVFSINIRPACLEINSQDLSADVKLDVAGWNGRFANLIKMKAITEPLSRCNKTFVEFGVLSGISDNIYCAFDKIGEGERFHFYKFPNFELSKIHFNFNL